MGYISYVISFSFHFHKLNVDRPDIRQHAVGIVIRSMFGFHDKERFETFVYSTYDKSGPNSDIYKKIKAEADHLIDLHEPDTYKAAKRSSHLFFSTEIYTGSTTIRSTSWLT